MTRDCNDDAAVSETTALMSANHNATNGNTAAPPEGLAENDHTMSMLETVVENLVETAGEIKEVIVDSIGEMKEVVVDSIEEIKEFLEETVVEPVAPRDPGEHDRKLNAIQLAVLVFYKVSGGPFGCEVSVKAAGAQYTLLGFAIFSVLWCLPEALVTAELGSAYPEPSGPIAWVEEAFGSSASLLCGYFHYISGSTDNAIYPSLFLKYLLTGSMPMLTRFIVCSVITIALSVVNYFGLAIVGHLSVAVAVISMSPFVLLCGAALPKLQPARWAQRPVGPVKWPSFLNNLFWNLNSFDVGANFAGEVKDPHTVFPRAMFLSVILVTLSYLLPLGATLGAVDAKQSDWDAGYFTDLSTMIAGPWLGIWMIVAAAVSNIALFQAELSGDSFQLLGMADRGLIPKLFAKRSRYQTPTNGIITGTVIIIAMSVADFEQLVEMLNFAYSLSFLMEFSAFICLRIYQPEVERPYKIPLNTFGCILLVSPPCIFLLYLLCSASLMTYIYLAALTGFGPLFHLFQKAAKHYDWLEYTVAAKRRTNSSSSLHHLT